MTGLHRAIVEEQPECGKHVADDAHVLDMMQRCTFCARVALLRLAYFSRIFIHGPDELFALLQCSGGTWLEMLKHDLVWLQSRVRHLQDMQHPADSLEQST